MWFVAIRWRQYHQSGKLDCCKELKPKFQLVRRWLLPGNCHGNSDQFCFYKYKKKHNKYLSIIEDKGLTNKNAIQLTIYLGQFLCEWPCAWHRCTVSNHLQHRWSKLCILATIQAYAEVAVRQFLDRSFVCLSAPTAEQPSLVWEGYWKRLSVQLAGLLFWKATAWSPNFRPLGVCSPTWCSEIKKKHILKYTA